MEWLELGNKRTWKGPIDKQQLLNILGANIKSGTNRPSRSLKRVFDFASSGTRKTSWRKIFGDNNKDSFSHTFVLTPGMMNGIYFDDKDEASYKVECLDGDCEFAIKSAVWSSWDQRSRTKVLSTGKSASGKYEVASRFYDATVFLYFKARGNNMAKVRVTFSAKDR